MKKTFRWTLILGLFVTFLGFGFLVIFVHRFHFTRPRGHFWFQVTWNNLPHLAHYTDRYSYFPGDSLRLFGSAFPSGETNVRILNVLDSFTVWIDTTISFSQQQVRDSASMKGARWMANLSVKIPEELQPGWYMVKSVRKQRVWRSSIFIRPKQYSSGKILYLFPALTWNAYNTWGGKSLYSPKPFPAYSFSRPNPASDPLMEDRPELFPFIYQKSAHDKRILELMEKEGMDAVVATDLDWALDTNLLDSARVILIGNHSEYWTEGMYRSLSAFLDRGGSLVILSGNTGFWWGEMDGGDVFRIHRDSMAIWRNRAPDLAGLLGISTATGSMQTFAPFEVLQSDDTLMKGLVKGNYARFGEDSYSVDWGNGESGIASFYNLYFKRDHHSAGSGLEYDRTWSHTPANWRTLARGLNPMAIGKGQVFPDPSIPWSRDGGAELGYYIHPGGGLVFNAGSVTFPGCVGLDPVADSLVTRLLRQISGKFY